MCAHYKRLAVLLTRSVLPLLHHDHLPQWPCPRIAELSCSLYSLPSVRVRTCLTGNCLLTLAPGGENPSAHDNPKTVCTLTFSWWHLVLRQSPIRIFSLYSGFLFGYDIGVISVSVIVSDSLDA